MSNPTAKSRARPAIELLEEAVRLLRRAPLSASICHFVGSAPCLLFGLYFFADLSRSAFARDQVLGHSFILAALYVWMKCWQAAGAARLRETLLGEEAASWDRPRVIRLIAVHALLQPVGLILRFWASVILIPLIWVDGFFQNVTALGDGHASGVREVCRRAWTEAKRWPLQAHLITVLLFLFSLFVFANFCTLMANLPVLMKSLLGIETVFSQHAAGLVNPTFFLAALALTYLCLDPIRKAAFVLRCFYGDAQRSGADLAVELRAIRRTRAVAAAIFLLCGFLPALPMHAASAGEPTRAAELNRSIDETLERREFAWREGREKQRELSRDELSWLERWRRDFAAWRTEMLRQIVQTLRDLWRKITGETAADQASSGGFGGARSVEFLLWTSLAVTGLVLLVLLLQRWRRPLLALAVAEANNARPDLREEQVSADQLPEDGWLQLARELIQSGDLRLALRALYLALLAHLGGRQLIQLARHKSNRDYHRELRRRARAQAELLETFQQTLRAYERGWYGSHPVTAETLGEFSQSLDRIRSC
ncbi:MAG TPA: DUF4129 domain-containing protein [Chthoniobacteraceae bacterium]|jgi:hypothetical protein